MGRLALGPWGWPAGECGEQDCGRRSVRIKSSSPQLMRLRMGGCRGLIQQLQLSEDSLQLFTVDWLDEMAVES